MRHWLVEAYMQLQAIRAKFKEKGDEAYELVMGKIPDQFMMPSTMSAIKESMGKA